MPIRSQRKVIEIGGSVGVTLPKNWIQGTNLGLGDTVEVYADGVLLIVPPTIKLNAKQSMRIFKEAGS